MVVVGSDVVVVVVGSDVVVVVVADCAVKSVTTLPGAIAVPVVGEVAHTRFTSEHVLENWTFGTRPRPCTSFCARATDCPIRSPGIVTWLVAALPPVTRVIVSPLCTVTPAAGCMLMTCVVGAVLDELVWVTTFSPSPSSVDVA